MRKSFKNSLIATQFAIRPKETRFISHGKFIFKIAEDQARELVLRAVRQPTGHRLALADFRHQALRKICPVSIVPRKSRLREPKTLLMAREERVFSRTVRKPNPEFRWALSRAEPAN